LATAYISHPECQRHDTGPGHPECARRLTAIEDRFLARGLFDVLRHIDAPMVTTEQLLRVHTREHLATIASMLPTEGYARLDPDTVISAGSLTAAHRAAGALVAAVDLVMSGDMDSAFCCVRPPGHHAERNLATGFCLFNNIAVGAAHALAEYGVSKIAIVDFDVHHGNGTEDIFRDNQQVLFCSTFQHPFYPFTPLLEDAPNRVSVPLDATAKSAEFRAAVTDRWLPALESFAPELVLVSAGFDAHEADDMSNVSLTDADFDWVTERIVDIAARHASGRVISTLEGGYDFDSLTRCVEQHVRIIMGLR
jgi:acetoin utilization deacetylase AcuC-like enzyme